MAKDSSPGDLAALDLLSYFEKETVESPGGLTKKQLEDRLKLIQKWIDSNGDLSDGVKSDLEACADEVREALKPLKK